MDKKKLAEAIQAELARAIETHSGEWTAEVGDDEIAFKWRNGVAEFQIDEVTYRARATVVMEPVSTIGHTLYVGQSWGREEKPTYTLIALYLELGGNPDDIRLNKEYQRLPSAPDNPDRFWFILERLSRLGNFETSTVDVEFVGIWRKIEAAIPIPADLVKIGNLEVIDEIPS